MIDGRWWPRWFAKWYANAFGYFWLPCPICEEYFGGQEWDAFDTVATNDPWRRVGHCGKASCRKQAPSRRAA